MKKIILITLIFILAACSAGGSEFERNRQKWTDANITHYRFQVSIGCFCPFQELMPLTVEVVDGQIVSMIGANGSEVLDTDPNYAFFAEYSAIENIFSKLEADLNGEADEVTVTYDSTYGFPTEIQIDRIKEAVDDELYISVSGFEPMS